MKYMCILDFYGLVLIKEFMTLEEAESWANEKIAYNGTRHYPHATFVPLFYRVEKL